jgi:hypothetical protein
MPEASRSSMRSDGSGDVTINGFSHSKNVTRTLLLGSDLRSRQDKRYRLRVLSHVTSAPVPADRLHGVKRISLCCLEMGAGAESFHMDGGGGGSPCSLCHRGTGAQEHARLWSGRLQGTFRPGLAGGTPAAAVPKMGERCK